MSRLITKYKQEGHLTSFKTLFAQFTNLELISEGFNFVINGDIAKAQEAFERLKLIPILKDDA